ncbi:hypothetical protein L1787_16605 [Acuticoccus sp. M5D2P5]|uniref:hypothetical protein n=1 Tax=Acuticoccus kalidii TaxID=2910977 RepID=UPI001F19808F|nr:hypothetical protein [Acuticoccus kalidii]MCF3935027.1 hypothetical protein [Acuticoccus kalidii]
MTVEIWPIVQGVCAVFGAGASLALLVDRLSKSRPSAYIIAKTLGPDDRRWPFIRVTNNSDRPILVSFENAEDRPIGLSIDNSIDAIAATLLDNISRIHVDGKAHRDIQIIIHPRLSREDHLTCVLKWRWAQLPRWRRNLREDLLNKYGSTLEISFTARQLDLLREDELFSDS